MNLVYKLIQILVYVRISLNKKNYVRMSDKYLMDDGKVFCYEISTSLAKSFVVGGMLYLIHDLTLSIYPTMTAE